MKYEELLYEIVLALRYIFYALLLIGIAVPFSIALFFIKI